MVNNKIFIWCLLIFSIAFLIAGEGFFKGRQKVVGYKKTHTEYGVGGGVPPQKLSPEWHGLDLELAGIPEPEEYSRPKMLTFSSYTLEKGDMIGSIAKRAGLNEDSIISVNNIKNTRTMQIGQVLRLPNQDGIYYSVKEGDTLENIAEKYNTTVLHISTANELFSGALTPSSSLFVPGGKLDWVNRQEINGELFIWPCSGYVSSSYGYRIAPFAGSRQFHSGIDIASQMGSAVKAAMAGRVSQVGNDYSWGNFVVISHHSGYRTFYAHMSAVRVKAGAYVGTGERIGDIGSTGLSTGPHLHFTVYKNGVTVNPRSLMR
jgi:murein DD-endopeptidase MepM/ murein hydrolase activator NlpD